MAYEYKKLEDVAIILDNKRKPVSEKVRQRMIGEIPYYGANGQVGWINDYLLDDKLILLAEDGGNYLDPFRPNAYTIEGKAWVNNHAHVLKNRSEIIDFDWLFYVLAWTDIRNYVSGTTRLKLNQTKMRAIPIPLPSLSVQKQIVSKIKECFTLLDKSEERLQKADNRLDRVMDIALISLITKDPSEVYETNIGELVEKKEMIAKRNLATEFEYIEISSISENFEIETTKRYSNSNAPSRARQLVREGNVLYSTVRPNLRRIAIVPQKLNLGICSTGFCNLRPRVDMIRSKYLYYWILRDNFTKEMVSLARGSQYPAVRDKDVLSSRILVPKDLAVQDEIIRKLDMYLNTSVKAKNKLIKVRETVQQLRQSILKKAFEGNLI